MPFDLPLSARLRTARWKVKSFDNEVRETPHARVIRGTRKWRYNLRMGEFMDAAPPPREVDPKVVAALVRE